MKRQVIHIPEYEWTAYVYYDTTPYDTEELLGKLRSLGCSENGVLRTRKQLLSVTIRKEEYSK